MWILMGAVAVASLGAVFIYNSLIAKKNQVQNVFGSIDALLKKRYELIPNLVATVKAYMRHERALLAEITEARARATSGRLSDEQQVELGGAVSRMLTSIMATVENYPELKASRNFMHLQRTLNELEEQISAARRAYNAAVTEYNNAVEMIPTSIVARLMGYKKKRVFEIEEDQRRSVDVGHAAEARSN